VGARTLSQILAEAGREMDEADAMQARAADPLAYWGVPRNRLIDRLHRR
jgi:hypothetical protein